MPLKGTQPGMRHADMTPATRARVDQQADVGRALGEYKEACVLLGREEVLPSYVARKRGEVERAVATLVECAQAEGAASAAEAVGWSHSDA